MSRLAGKSILVSGSTRGIGRQMARRFAAEGAAVLVTGRSVPDGESIAEEISSSGGRATFAQCDATSEADVERAVQVATDTYGGLHGVVANAADTSHSDGPITELTLEQWNGLLRADLTSTFLVLKHGLRALCEGSGGSVVTISSHMALEGVNGGDGYTAAKGAIVALTRSVASYYARYDIRCNCLAVGMTDSGNPRVRSVLSDPAFAAPLMRQHLGRIGTTDDVANVALHLLADESVFVNGAIIPVDGGSYAASHLSLPSMVDLSGYDRKRVPHDR
jgi:NAD(P)-dependent dehydrogenase (short-subunit alcohol dehydrogenase family)